MAIDGVGFDSKETVQALIDKIKSQYKSKYKIQTQPWNSAGNRYMKLSNMFTSSAGLMTTTYLVSSRNGEAYLMICGNSDGSTKYTPQVIKLRTGTGKLDSNGFYWDADTSEIAIMTQGYNIVQVTQIAGERTDFTIDGLSTSNPLANPTAIEVVSLVPTNSVTSGSSAPITSGAVATVKETADHANLDAYIARREIGDITALETTTQDDLVSAINEVKEKTDNNETNIGDLSDLQTSTKTNLVSAINEAAEGSFFVKIYNSLSKIQSAEEHDIVLIKSSETLPSYVGISLRGRTPPYTLFRYEKDGSNTLKWVPISSSTSSFIQRYSLGSVLNRVVVASSGTITISQESFETMFGTGTIARASLEIKALVSGEFKTVAYMMFNIIGNVIKDYRGLTTSNVTYSGKTATVTGLPTTGTNYQLYPVLYSSENNYS